MPKTPEQVISKLQRRLENTAYHTQGLIDHLAGARKDVRRFEDLLAWIYKKHVYREDALSKEICSTIAVSIPTTLKRKGLIAGDE